MWAIGYCGVRITVLIEAWLSMMWNMAVTNVMRLVVDHPYFNGRAFMTCLIEQCLRRP